MERVVSRPPYRVRVTPKLHQRPAARTRSAAREAGFHCLSTTGSTLELRQGWFVKALSPVNSLQVHVLSISKLAALTRYKTQMPRCPAAHWTHKCSGLSSRNARRSMQSKVACRSGPQSVALTKYDRAWRKPHIDSPEVPEPQAAVVPRADKDVGRLTGEVDVARRQCMRTGPVACLPRIADVPALDQECQQCVT